MASPHPSADPLPPLYPPLHPPLTTSFLTNAATTPTHATRCAMPHGRRLRCRLRCRLRHCAPRVHPHVGECLGAPLAPHQPRMGNTQGMRPQRGVVLPPLCQACATSSLGSSSERTSTSCIQLVEPSYVGMVFPAFLLTRSASHPLDLRYRLTNNHMNAASAWHGPSPLCQDCMLPAP